MTPFLSSPLLNTLSLLLLAAVVVVSLANASTHVQLTLLGTPVSVGVGIAMLVSALVAAAAVFLLTWGRVAQVRNQQLKAALARDKAEVSAEASSDRIRALEAKVATLEKALDSALASAAARENSGKIEKV